MELCAHFHTLVSVGHPHLTKWSKSAFRHIVLLSLQLSLPSHPWAGTVYHSGNPAMFLPSKWVGPRGGSHNYFIGCMLSPHSIA